jgi:ABC-2 type transport system ATP-binding protein
MEQLADDLLIVAAGRVVAQGSIGDVLGSLAGVRTLVRTPDVEKLTQALGPEATITAGQNGDVYVTGPDAAGIGEAAQRAGIALHQLTTERPDLESVFLELTSGKAEIR